MQLLKVSIFVNMNTVVAKSRVFEVVECSCINEFRFVHLCVILYYLFNLAIKRQRSPLDE